MSKTLEDLYYGNINPAARRTIPDSELSRAASRATRFEQQIADHLDETGRELLGKLVENQQEISSLTAMENFVLGFRLGVQMMAECMVEDGSDT